MLAPLAARTPAVSELLPELDAVAAEYGSSPISAYLLTPDAPRPPGPESHYLALMAVSLATFDTLVRDGLQPYALVGHGLGELWAQVAAGVLSAGDGARLACERSRALTGLNWQGTMMSLDVSAVQGRHLVALLDHPHLVVGCDDTPQRCVLSGPGELMPLASRIAEHLGWTSTELHVPHPAHTPAVAAAAADLRHRLPDVKPSAARWPVFSPTLGRLLTPDDDPVAVTANAMLVTVHFQQAVTALSARGAEVFLECGAGDDAVTLIRAILPAAITASPLTADAPWLPLDPPSTLTSNVPAPALNGPAPASNGSAPTPNSAAHAEPVALPRATADLAPTRGHPGDTDQDHGHGQGEGFGQGRGEGQGYGGGQGYGQGEGFGQGRGRGRGSGWEGVAWVGMVDGAVGGQAMRPRLAPAPLPSPATERMLPPATLLLCGRADAPALRALTDDRDDVVVADADTIDWTWLPLTPRHLRVVARPGPDAGLVHQAMLATAARFPHLRSIAALVMDAVREEVVPHPIAGLFTGAIQPLAAELADCACVAVATTDVELPAALDALAAELQAAPPLLAAFYQGRQRLLYELTLGEHPWPGDGRSRPSTTPA
ncbi:acyltransferase domain-containing protein [Nonomuraea sp. NPDC047529]|uniref:acyltransferase domain-containing protein n=1 Tax=Nonomuraea sp. NPDC047529 TaxID=3155623 RepID=UPI0033DE4C79